MLKPQLFFAIWPQRIFRLGVNGATYPEAVDWEQEVTMKSHRLPFENRWTDGAHAWQWNCELDRIGVPNVRAMFADHEAHYRGRPTVVFDIPVGFVQDWLAFHDRKVARQQLLWRVTVIALTLVAASAAVLGLLRA
jgi:hypothetical protein